MRSVARIKLGYYPLPPSEGSRGNFFIFQTRPLLFSIRVQALARLRPHDRSKTANTTKPLFPMEHTF